MAEQTRRPYATITVPRWTEREVPAGMLAVAQKRTAHLAGRAFRQSPEEITISAYMQGVDDTMAALEKHSLLKKD